MGAPEPQTSGEEPSREARAPRTTQLPKSLIERARAAVYWVRVIPGEPSSYSELTERALRVEVERLEAEYNEGEMFAIPEGEGLRPGPAPGVMQRVADMRKAAREHDQVDDDPAAG